MCALALGPGISVRRSGTGREPASRFTAWVAAWVTWHLPDGRPDRLCPNPGQGASASMTNTFYADWISNPSIAEPPAASRTVATGPAARPGGPTLSGARRLWRPRAAG